MLSLTAVDSDLSLPEQRRLYLSHPYDREFVAQVDAAIQNNELPNFITLAWLTWWFLHQDRYSVVSVYCHDDWGKSAAVLIRRELHIFYEESSYQILLPTDCSYANVCQLMRLGEDPDEYYTPWCSGNMENMKFIAHELSSQLTDIPLTSFVIGMVDFDAIPDLYLREEVIYSAVLPDAPSRDYVRNLAKVGNDFLTKFSLLDYKGWRHQNDSRYRYFITNIKEFEFITTNEKLGFTFTFEVIVVLDWAYHHFLDHHLDRIASYSNGHWQLEELQEYARKTWNVPDGTREELLAKIKTELDGTDWVASLTCENL